MQDQFEPALPRRLDRTAVRMSDLESDGPGSIRISRWTFIELFSKKKAFKNTEVAVRHYCVSSLKWFDSDL